MPDPTDTTGNVGGLDLDQLINVANRINQLTGGGGNTIQVPTVQAPSGPPVEQSWASHIGEALGGGGTSMYGLTPAQREAAGNAALLNFGMGVLANAPGHSFGQAFAGGGQAAQGVYSSMADQQAALIKQAQEQQQTRLASLKGAIDLLNSGIQLRQMGVAAGMPNPLAGGGGGGATAAAPGKGTTIEALTGDWAHDQPIIKQRESGGNYGAENYVALADPSARARGATASGAYQMVDSTWREGAKLAGVDISKWPRAMDAPPAVQDQVAQAVYGKYGTAPWDASKFGSNWVKQPDGTYQLVKGAPYTPPPGQTTTATATPAPQPATKADTGKSPAQPASPFGATAFSSPATRAPAPASTATAPVTDAEVPAVPTPQLTAARAVATKTGKPAPISGSDNLFVTPDGKVTLGPGAGGLGKRADASDALIGGALTAQTTMPPTGGLVAGPGAPGGATPPAPTAAPGGAFGGGAFSTAPYAASTAPTPPAATPAPPATTTPPGATQQPSMPQPGESRTDYINRLSKPPTDAEVKTFTVPVDEKARSDAADEVANARQAQAAAAQALTRARMTPGADETKATAAYNTATERLTAANQNLNQIIAQAGKDTVANRTAFIEARRKELGDAYDKVQADVQAQANRDAEMARVQEGGAQQRLTNKEAVANEVNKGTLIQASKDQIDARNLASQVEGFQALSGTMGQPGWMLTTKNPFGSGETVADKLQQLGYQVTDNQTYQLMRTGINELIKTLRAGMPMDSLSDRDLDFIRNMGPTEWLDQDTRNAVTSYILQAARAKQKFAYTVQKELSRPGGNTADAIEAADKAVKPFVPEVPPDLSAHWTDPSAEWSQRRKDWASENHIGPGTLYHLSTGEVGITHRPPATQ